MIFLVWDRNGISQANELQSLQATGVQSINLTSSTVNASYADGNATLAQSGSFTRTNGSVGYRGTVATYVRLLMNSNSKRYSFNSYLCYSMFGYWQKLNKKVAYELVKDFVTRAHRPRGVV
jgi:hypothetical protein